ncbi:hypothetical protein KHQ81_12900 [Mycoplasmatota bacterium]|nr:hypothetical protein KHQ81_12900 [Mycoplasmatota bacterium]
MAKSKWPRVKEKLILVEAWARDGLTDEQIWHNLGIGKDTFYRYKKEHQDFSDALKSGKEVVDVQVENAMLKAALGYHFIEESMTKDGRVVPLKKYAHPNTTAQIFWLKNRRPAQWRDKQEIDHSGSMDINTNPMKDLSTEDLKRLAKMADEE